MRSQRGLGQKTLKVRLTGALVEAFALGVGMGFAAEAVLGPETPDHEEGFLDDFAGHFGAALEAVGEDDRDFNDAQALAPDFVGHLDLEAVAVGADVFEIERLEGLSAETFEAAGRV